MEHIRESIIVLAAAVLASRIDLQRDAVQTDLTIAGAVQDSPSWDREVEYSASADSVL
jgi:hypothetical protein